MCPELLPADQDGNVGEDVPAAEAVQIEQDVAGVTRELDAAVGQARHPADFWRDEWDTHTKKKVHLYVSCM